MGTVERLSYTFNFKIYILILRENRNHTNSNGKEKESEADKGKEDYQKAESFKATIVRVLPGKTASIGGFFVSFRQR